MFRRSVRDSAVVVSQSADTADAMMSTGSTVDSTMTAEQLIVSLDVALRENRHLIVNTILAVLEKAGDNVSLKFEYICQIILIAFKRRNHEKSQANGTGSGEKDILRTILLTLYVVAPDSVKAVLPLVPQYGSWKDLNLMAERCMDINMSVLDGLSEADGSSTSDSNDSLDDAAVEVPELCTVIVNLFADQMAKDYAAMTVAAADSSSSSSSSSDTVAVSTFAEGSPVVVLPSSASKYTFSEARHRGSKTNRKAAKVSRAHKIQTKLADMVASRLLSKGLGEGMTLQKRELRPLYRKYVAALRAQLATNGFMIEHHMCNRTPKLIQFTRAPKGSLEKYSAAINKDPEAKAKWLCAAKKSQNAVPDINELRDAALQAEVEMRLPVDQRILGRRVIKAVSSMQAARTKLVASTQALLDQLESDGNSSNQEAGVAASVIAVQRAMNAAVRAVVYPVVDTYGCTSQSDVDTLLLAAYIVARSQMQQCGHAVGFIVFNGQLIRLEGQWQQPQQPPHVPAGSNDIGTSGDINTKPVRVTNADIVKAMEWYTGMNQRLHGWQSTPSRGENEVSLALQAGGAHILAALEGGSDVPRDLMLLTIALPDDITALTDAVAVLQQPTSTTASYNVDPNSLTSVSVGGSGDIMPTDEQPRSLPTAGFRSVLVHKVAAVTRANDINFKLRTHGKTLPPLNQLVIDVCILMDFTGSMGSWMSAAKQHLVSIIQSLRGDTKAKEVRVAFVGYRDYKDTSRVVKTDFVGVEQADEVIAAIQHEEADGGADEPEDVLSGFIAVNSLDWKGDIRVCLHVADATAHGYTDSCEYIHDDYPSGFCPDQKNGSGLAESVTQTADEKCIDLVFCECNPSRTGDLRRLYRGIYTADNGAGFAVMPLSSATDFKDNILGTLSAAVLSLCVQESVSGLQSFAGNTLSAIISTMNTSLRESLLTVSAQVEALQIEEVEEKSIEKENDNGAGVADACCSSESEAMDVAITTDVAAVSMMSDTGPDTSDLTAGRPLSKVRQPNTDYERLVSELQSQNLAPVRFLLGMPVASNLALSAGKTLIDSGLTVADLQRMGYPASIIQVFVEAAALCIKTV